MTAYSSRLKSDVIIMVIVETSYNMRKGMLKHGTLSYHIHMIEAYVRGNPLGTSLNICLHKFNKYDYNYKLKQAESLRDQQICNNS